MKTIEERAKEAGVVCQYKSDYRYDKRSVEFGYTQGATEQKAIDEEVRLKKCDDMTEEEYERVVAFSDWYNKNGKGTPTFSDAIEWARRELLDGACKWLDIYLHLFVMKGHINHSALEQELRKAMEE